MEYNKFIENLSDFRGGQGQRYPFSFLMWLIFLSTASGHTSCRPMAVLLSSNICQVNYFTNQNIICQI